MMKKQIALSLDLWFGWYSTVCGGALALNQHSQHKHTSVTASQHLHRGTKGKSTSSSAKKKEGDKRLDLFQLPNKKRLPTI